MKWKARLEPQLKLYKIMVVPMAIYGDEIWIVRKNHETEIQTAEMKFLHVTARYMHTDHQYKKITGKKLKVFNLNIKIQNYRIYCSIYKDGRLSNT